jgi:cytochrome c oxidase cbb3-type subunit 1
MCCAFGGLLYLTGACFMTYNIWRTIAVGDLRDEKPLHNIDQNRDNDRPLNGQHVAVPAE